MDMENSSVPRSPNPRRRRRSKLQIFKEAYLPTIILAVTFVLIVVFVIGALVSGEDPQGTEPSGSEAPNPSVTESSAPDQTEPTIPPALQQEAQDCLAQAKQQADMYNYDGALATLDGFSGDLQAFPELVQAYQTYTNIKLNMVDWNASDVINLSFQLLIADPARAFPDDVYGSLYKRNFVTVSEFSAILQQLYDNGYVLVSMDDFYYEEFNTSNGRYVFKEKTVQLPAGKKPIMITETNVNYYNYMIDSNGDGKPDAGADGFAARLCHDENGFYNEIVNADGSVSTGSYDLVPLLEDFIAENPDFSYRGARAIIAFSGYDGVLGYRINSTKLGAAALQTERDGAAAIIEALKNAGYDLACYTYDNLNYNTATPARVQQDIQKWLDEIAPWIGGLDMLVFARDTDIAGTESYSGNSKFNVLYNAGFKYFLGMMDTGAWNQVDEQYVRQNRMSVSGYYMLNHPQMYEGLFDVEAVKDSARG